MIATAPWLSRIAFLSPCLSAAWSSCLFHSEGNTTSKLNTWLSVSGLILRRMHFKFSVLTQVGVFLPLELLSSRTSIVQRTCATLALTDFLFGPKGCRDVEAWDGSAARTLRGEAHAVGCCVSAPLSPTPTSTPQLLNHKAGPSLTGRQATASFFSAFWRKVERCV